MSGLTNDPTSYSQTVSYFAYNKVAEWRGDGNRAVEIIGSEIAFIGIGIFSVVETLARGVYALALNLLSCVITSNVAFNWHVEEMTKNAYGNIGVTMGIWITVCSATTTLLNLK